MCSVIFLRRPDDAWPLILAANRDEMLSRPWKAPARHWPDRPEIVAGLDETPESERAVAVARLLAARLGSQLYVVTATRADPVSVLADESEAADLLVVGSRGLRGVRRSSPVAGARASRTPCAGCRRGSSPPSS